MVKFWRSLTTWIVIAFMKSDWHVMPNYPSKLLTRHSVFWWRVWLLMGETDPASQWLTHQDGINGMMDDIMRAIEGRSWWIKKMDYHMGDKYLTYYCDIIVHVEQIFFTLFFSCTFCICLSHFHSYCTTVVCNVVIKMIYIYIYIYINQSLKICKSFHSHAETYTAWNNIFHIFKCQAGMCGTLNSIRPSAGKALTTKLDMISWYLIVCDTRLSP